ncbi:MAG: hypothetical protein H6573_25600 [Lewinellaceae bacterium]|nr:hypothetical protein [Lewinellaceae bacterium]
MRQRRRLKGQIRHRDAMIMKMQAQIRELQAITKPQPVFNCVYPAQMIPWLFTLSCAAVHCAVLYARLAFYAEMMGCPYSAPSWKTASNWVQRCGLYALKLAHYT